MRYYDFVAVTYHPFPEAIHSPEAGYSCYSPVTTTRISKLSFDILVHFACVKRAASVRLSQDKLFI